MDEGTLNDLLECSVCLERLDTSSKVLPCQHTFCKKCLEEILERHKELRCPECRVLVPPKIDELPPNVLLMRILEGMRNALPKNQPKSVKGNNTTNMVHHATPLLHHTPTPTDRRNVSNKEIVTLPLQPHQTYAKALYDYSSNELEDLNFRRGEMIIIKKKIDANWYHGECSGKQGVFPISYVQVITPLPSNIPQCKALYDFRMTNDDEEGCLTFNKGDIISVIRRVDENWAEGKLDGRIGIFPLAFVELNNLARSLMKLSTNSQPGPSRLAPPTPTADDSSPLIPTDHSSTVAHIVNSAKKSSQQTAVGQVHHQGLHTLDSTITSGSSSTTPNTSSSNTSSTSSTAPSSPASPPPRVQPNFSKNIAIKQESNAAVNTLHDNLKSRSEAHSSSQNKHEKRHSFTSLTSPPQQTPSHRHSVELINSEYDGQTHSQKTANDQTKRCGEIVNTSNVYLPAAYIALYPYKPQKSDELELRKGGIYMVSECCQDGWFKGTSNRTQKCGVFPGNYVTVAHGAHRSPQASHANELTVEQNTSVNYDSSNRTQSSPKHIPSNPPPELPPRSGSPSLPINTVSASWHGNQDAPLPVGRSNSAMPNATHLLAGTGKSTDKVRERKEKGSLMRRLTSMKRPKSPPPSTYSMDNPVFEDNSVPESIGHPLHVRSGSCPSQLLQVQPNDCHRLFASVAIRNKHKERPSIVSISSRSTDNPSGSSGSSPDVHHHRKSNSLDAGNRTKTRTQTVHERFRCITPYPPNSEYELELEVNDVIYVHKKREDGWYKGLQQRTGKTGLFPASFVENF